MSKISDAPAPIYPDYCPMKLDRDGNYYSRHVEAMTTENLHRKSDIAEQLAWRDREIDRLRADMAQIVGCLPGVYCMDPPDGGDVSIPEQVRRMAEDAAKHREAAQPSPAGQGDVRALAEQITDHLCHHEYDIGGRAELLACVVEAIAAQPAQAVDLDTLKAVSDEYNEWILFHDAGNGSFDDFLKGRALIDSQAVGK